MSTIFRDSAKLLTANVIAQAIGLLVYPILTRLYSPDDFGLYNLFLSIGGVLVLLSTAGYHNAIVLPKSEDKARAVTHVGLMILAAVTLLIVISIPFSRPIARLFNTLDLANWWWLMPIYVAVMGAWTLLNYFYTRKGQFTRVSGYQVSQSALNACAKVGFGYAGFLSGGLIVSSVIGPFLSILVSICVAWRKCLSALTLPCKREEYKTVAYEYRNFPKFSLPRGLVNYIALQMPVLLLIPVFGTHLVGFWSMAMLLAFMPISLISRTINQVMFQRVAAWVRDKQSIAQYFRRFTITTFAIAVPVAIGLYFILPWLTQWLLGAEWRPSGQLIRYMLPWIVVSILAASCSYLSDVFMKQKQGFIIEIILAASRAIGIGIGIYMHDFMIAIIGYATASAVVILGQYIWLMSLVRNYERTSV